MGTNYYRIPTEAEMAEKKKKLAQEIGELSMQAHEIEAGFATQAEDSLHRESPWDRFIDGQRIHLGKRSGGWKFCWNFHSGKHYQSKEELLCFIRAGRVVDEYGREMPAEEFIGMALAWGQPDGLSVNAEYESKMRSDGRGFSYGPKHWDREIDGLRVSSSTDFS